MTKKGGFRCALKDCSNISGRCNKSFFRFPSNTERSKLWKDACDRKDLETKTTKELYKNYRVCSVHFTKDMFLNDSRNRLQPHALPVLKNNAKEQQSSMKYRKLLPKGSVVVTPGHFVQQNAQSQSYQLLLTSVPEAVQQINVSSKFTTSRTWASSSKDDHLHIETADPTLKSKLSFDEGTIRQTEINTIQSITSSNGKTNKLLNVEVPVSENRILATNIESEKKTPIVSAITPVNWNIPENCVKQTRNLVQLVPTLVMNPEFRNTYTSHTQTQTSETFVTPREQRLRQNLQRAKAKIRRLEISLKKERMKPSKKPSLSQFDYLIDKFLPDEIGRFVKYQVHQSIKKPNGRRYTHEFKQFCSSIYSSGPSAYRKISSLFCLPSSRSLQRMKIRSQNIQNQTPELTDMEPIDTNNKQLVISNEQISMNSEMVELNNREEETP